MKIFAPALIATSLLVSAPLVMADKVTTERVKFASGTSGTSIQGEVKGYDTMQYLVGAKGGQAMTVSLATKSTSTYFNIFAPGKKPGADEAMFAGDRDGSTYQGTLPANGDYLIQVYLYRNAARKNETAAFTLDVSVNAGSATVDGVEGDANVSGTDLNATGVMPCTREAGQPMMSCAFGVIREGNGKGSVTISWPDGGSRVIFFESGKPASFDQSEADGGAKMLVEQNADLFMVKIGDQRFEFPDAVINGG